MARTTTRTELFTVQMGVERETKGAIRYRELDPDTGEFVEQITEGSVGQIYVRKHSLPDPAPQRLTVTFTVE